ncbi:MAG: transcription termination/antitermination protein NusG [Spirochaetia bacterium]
MARGWYVLSVYSGHEGKIEKFLRTMMDRSEVSGLLDVCVPMEEVVEVVNGKRRTVNKKFLPGYVLLDMDLPENGWQECCLKIKHIQGVLGFVGQSEGGAKPNPISQDEARTILQKSGDIKVEKAVRLRQDYRLGEKVRIIDGPFDGFTGDIEGVDADRGKLRVMVPIFGRDTPVELDFSQVERL